MDERARPSAPETAPSPKGGSERVKPDARPAVSPPYWRTHVRNNSVWSNGTAECHRPAIVLQDNEEVGSESSKALWARHVTVADYVIVSGNAPSLGSYVVWNCVVDTLDVSQYILPRFRRVVSKFVAKLPCSINTFVPVICAANAITHAIRVGWAYTPKKAVRLH